MKPTWDAERINEEARARADMAEDVRRLTRRGDWDYVATLRQNTHIAAGAGLRHIAMQKADGASQMEANMRAVWERADAMIANAGGQIPPASGGNLDRLVGGAS